MRSPHTQGQAGVPILQEPGRAQVGPLRARGTPQEISHKSHWAKTSKIRVYLNTNRRLSLLCQHAHVFSFALMPDGQWARSHRKYWTRQARLRGIMRTAI